MSLPNSSRKSPSAPRKDDCHRAGAAEPRSPQGGIKPRDIMTREALRTLTVVIALGGSTNAVLHLLAMAPSAGQALDRRLHACRQTCTPSRRSQAIRQIRHGSPPHPHRRPPAPHEGVAFDARPAAWWLPHRDRPDRGENLREVASIRPRPGRPSFRSPTPHQARQSLARIAPWQSRPEGTVAKVTGKGRPHFFRPGHRL